MKKIILLAISLLTICGVKANFEVNYGIGCSTKTNYDVQGDPKDRKIIPSNLFAGVKIGEKHSIGLKVETAISDMYTFDLDNLAFKFNPDKINYILEISHKF